MKVGNDMISRSALLENIKRGYCADCNSCHGVVCMSCEIGDTLNMIEDAPAVDAVPAEKLGKLGKLMIPYSGCARGPVGRMGDGNLEKEALFFGEITDVDGGKWVPVVKEVLLELIEKAKENSPAVDGVKLVRCGNCKHWMKDVAGCTKNVGRCEFANYFVGLNGYCVYGERKERC